MREVRAGTQGRDLEAGTEVEAIEDHCLMACSSSPAQPAFLYSLRPPAQGDAAHNGLSLPTSIINQEAI